MDALNRSLVAAAFALWVETCPGSACAQSTSLDRWDSLVADASRTFDLPASWIKTVIRVESGGLTVKDGRPITSAAGAMGLMQIMPRTWGYLRDEYRLGTDPYDPHDNIFAGTAFLRDLYRQYGYPNLFAAYSAGPARLARYLAGIDPLPEETSTYLTRLAHAGLSGTAPVSLHGAGGLFFKLTSPSIPSGRPAFGSLFVQLRSR